jgi:hypothetical protein
MALKILAGIVAAVLVTAIGIGLAVPGGPSANATDDQTLPVSEGSCCAQSLAASCCADAEPATCQPDVLAACTGGVAVATSSDASTCTKAVGCCAD